jgi:hypothetical protein
MGIAEFIIGRAFARPVGSPSCGLQTFDKQRGSRPKKLARPYLLPGTAMGRTRATALRAASKRSPDEQSDIRG